MKHTPIPYTWAMTLLGGDPDCNRRILYGERGHGRQIAVMNYHMNAWSEQDEADAAFIIDAVNSIERERAINVELIKALDDTLRALNSKSEDYFKKEWSGQMNILIKAMGE